MKKLLRMFFYRENKLKLLLYTALYYVIGVFVVYTFLDSIISGIIVITLLLPVFIGKTCKYIEQKRQNNIENEFYIMLNSISMSLASGMTIENALRETILAEKKKYKVIYKDLERIYRMLQNNYSPDKAFKIFAEKSENREIRAFSEVLSVGLPAGINLAALIRYVSSAYRMQNDTNQEIKRILNAPKYNNRIILIMPVICVVLFRNIAPSYFSVLYNGSGHIIMAVVLGMLIVAWWLGEKLSNIKY